jgi:hypothetical protein
MKVLYLALTDLGGIAELFTKNINSKFAVGRRQSRKGRHLQNHPQVYKCKSTNLTQLCSKDFQLSMFQLVLTELVIKATEIRYLHYFHEKMDETAPDVGCFYKSPKPTRYILNVPFIFD